MTVVSIEFESGSMADYEALAPFHYRGTRPATITRIVRAIDASPKGTSDRRLVGVLVTSMPQPACALRDIATNGRYRGLGRFAAAALARELRTISRVIVHPQHRGLGIAVQLVRHALETADTIATEALAAMGNVHPFFERAGMIAYRRPDHFNRPEHARLLAALHATGIEPATLASTRRMLEAIEHLPAETRRWLEHELREWRRRACFLSKRDAAREPIDLKTLLPLIRAKALTNPVYYFHRREACA